MSNGGILKALCPSVPKTVPCLLACLLTSPCVNDEVCRGVDGQEQMRDVYQAGHQRRGWTLGHELTVAQAAKRHFVHIGNDLHGLAENEENRDGNENHSEVRFALLSGCHVRVDFVLTILERKPCLVIGASVSMIFQLSVKRCT